MNLRASYCTGYFVMYVCVCHKAKPVVKVGRFVLFNLVTEETKAEITALEQLSSTWKKEQRV